LNGEDLLGNHREHLNVNAVELIETSPGTTRRQTSKESAHHVHIETIGAVENHTLDGKGFSQILCRFGLTGTGGSSRIASEVKVECAGQRHVALIRERCDNETWSISKILVGIPEAGDGLLGEAVEISVLTFVLFTVRLLYLLPVVA
jgi:hypothetical protein